MPRNYFETCFTIINSNPGKSYTLYSPVGEERYGLPEGVLEVGENDVLRYKLDLYDLEVGQPILLFHSAISNTFSTISRYDHPISNTDALAALKELKI